MISYLSKTKEQGKISRVMIMQRVRSLWDQACEFEQAAQPHLLGEELSECINRTFRSQRSDMYWLCLLGPGFCLLPFPRSQSQLGNVNIQEL